MYDIERIKRMLIDKNEVEAESMGYDFEIADELEPLIGGCCKMIDAGMDADFITSLLTAIIDLNVEVKVLKKKLQ